MDCGVEIVFAGALIPMRDTIITGIPRAGTTLAAAIVDQAADCCCLSEPSQHVELMTRSTSESDFVDRLESSFAALRATLRAGGSVTDRRSADGSPLTNYFHERAAGPRQPAFIECENARPGLSRHFFLGVKHNALYCATLPEIARRAHFGIIAVVRHPADVVASWHTLSLPVSSGKLPAAERYWPEMRELTHATLPLLDKQLLIYELLCKRLQSLDARVAIIRYEEMIRNPALVLTAAGIPAESAGGGIDIAESAPARPPAIERRRHALTQAGLLPATASLYPCELPILA